MIARFLWQINHRLEEVGALATRFAYVAVRRVLLPSNVLSVGTMRIGSVQTTQKYLIMMMRIISPLGMSFVTKV